MTRNRRTVEAYLDGFRTVDRERILSCLAEDVEWRLPGAFEARGKAAFAAHIVDEGFTGRPSITVVRMLEVDDAVVVEGAVRAPKAAGGFLDLEFCDVFDLCDGKIRKLTSYLMTVGGT